MGHENQSPWHRAGLSAGILALAVAAWWLLGRWIIVGAERFYLLVPPTVVAIYLANSSERWTELRRQLVPASIGIGVLTILSVLYNLLVTGTNVSIADLRWDRVVFPVYFLCAICFVVILPMRWLRRFCCWVDEKAFGPIAAAARGRLPRVFLREALPALLILPIVLPYFLGVTYVHRLKVPNLRTPRELIQREYDDVVFHAADGTTLRGWFIPALQPSSQTLIICHGLGGNRSNFLHYSPVGDDLGANVLIFDFRGHGDSDGNTISYGYFEKQDVLGAIEYLREHRPEQARQIYGLGISMGTSPLILAAAEVEPPLDAVILDSAFASAVELTDNILVDFPAVLRPLLSAGGVPVASLHAGCPLEDVRPIDHVGNLRAPVGFIHAREDRLIPLDHAQRLLAEAATPKYLSITDTGGHGTSWLDRPNYLEFVRSVVRSGKEDESQ